MSDKNETTVKPPQATAPTFGLNASAMNPKVKFVIKDSVAQATVPAKKGGEVVTLTMKKGGAK